MSKAKKYHLVYEEEEAVEIGLLRLAKATPDYLLFFHINNLNEFNFGRVEDLTVEGQYFSYQFPVFAGYHPSSKSCYRIIANKSSESVFKKIPEELFADEENVKFLLKSHPDVDYIITTPEESPDFSLILLPENLVFAVQHYLLPPHEDLHQLIQYYE